MRPAGGADNYAILVVPNVKIRMETQNSLPLLSLHNLLGKSLHLYTGMEQSQNTAVV